MLIFNNSNTRGMLDDTDFLYYTGITFLLIMGVIRLSSSEVHAANGDRPIPPEYFGLHISRIVQTQPWYPNGDRITPWPSIKFGSWRLGDAYVGWPLLEPERGKWNFQTLDKYVALAGRAGLTSCHSSASPRPRPRRGRVTSGYLPGNAAEPRNSKIGGTM